MLTHTCLTFDIVPVRFLSLEMVCFVQVGNVIRICSWWVSFALVNGEKICRKDPRHPCKEMCILHEGSKEI